MDELQRIELNTGEPPPEVDEEANNVLLLVRFGGLSLLYISHLFLSGCGCLSTTPSIPITLQLPMPAPRALL